MASSSDEQPKPPEPPAAAVVAAPPQTHAEWAASLQAYYAAAGHPYAWPAQVRFWPLCARSLARVAAASD
jgi:plant G-box-binding factor